MKLKPVPHEFSRTGIDSLTLSFLGITMTDDCFDHVRGHLYERLEEPLQLTLSWEIALALREQTGYAEEIIIT